MTPLLAAVAAAPIARTLPAVRRPRVPARSRARTVACRGHLDAARGALGECRPDGRRRIRERGGHGRGRRPCRRLHGVFRRALVRARLVRIGTPVLTCVRVLRAPTAKLNSSKDVLMRL